jgi:hypothetical protein
MDDDDEFRAWSDCLARYRVRRAILFVAVYAGTALVAVSLSIAVWKILGKG